MGMIVIMRAAGPVCMCGPENAETRLYRQVW